MTTLTGMAVVLANILPIVDVVHEYLDTRRHKRGLPINIDGFLIDAQLRLGNNAVKDALTA